MPRAREPGGRGRWLLLTAAVICVGCRPSDADFDVRITEADVPTSPAFEEVVARARQEGLLNVSSYSAPTPALEALARQFERIYGIRVNISALGTSQFFARLETERRAGSLGTDLRLSSFSDAAKLAVLGLSQSFGKLPAASDPAAEWLPPVDPLREVKAGRESVIYRATGWTILANEELLPPTEAPRSWKDLADPAYRGMIYLFDPRINGPGCDMFMHLYNAYGDAWAVDFMRNVEALTRTPYQAEKQVARGEYAMTLPTSSAGIAPLWRIPEPRPFYLIEPDDGVMIIVSTLTLLSGAEHPDAARAWANFLLSRRAQEIQARESGGGAIRADVPFAEPELAYYVDQPAFPGTPESFEWRTRPAHDCATLVSDVMERADVAL